MSIELGVLQISILGGVVIIAQYVFYELIKSLFQRKNNEVLEQLQWDVKIKEQAEKVAEYMSLARNIKDDSPPEDFVKANRLAWELAMWLPGDLYKSMGQALVNPTDSNNVLTIITEVRKLLLSKDIGGLTPDDIINHAPGIGNQDN